MQRDKSIGIDPSKAKLDVYVTTSKENRSFENTGKGINKLVKFIMSHSPDIVTIETTSKYHRKAARMISEAGVAILLAQPKRVRDFARGLGILAKTDPIDARCIALYGQKSDLKPSTLPTPEEELLRDIVARRQQLVKSVSAEKNRLSSTVKELQSSCKRNIKFLELEIGKINKLISKQLGLCKGAKKRLKIIVSAKGVGEIVAATLIAYLPELGSLTKREIASLCGLAPFNHDSGKFSGKRSIYGGRTIVRSALYMAALSASRFDPIIKEFYQRLLNKGKAKKVALTAVMRKLIVKLNAMVRDQATCAYA